MGALLRPHTVILCARTPIYRGSLHKNSYTGALIVGRPQMGARLRSILGSAASEFSSTPLADQAALTAPMPKMLHMGVPKIGGRFLVVSMTSIGVYSGAPCYSHTDLEPRQGKPTQTKNDN